MSGQIRLRGVRLVALLAIAGLCCAAVFGAAGAGAAAKKKKTTTFSGLTSEHQPLTFTVGGGHVKNFKTIVGYNGACGQGGGAGYSFTIRSMKVKNGKFNGSITTNGGISAIPKRKIVVNGKLSGKHASGSVNVPSIKCSNGKPAYRETFSLTGH